MAAEPSSQGQQTPVALIGAGGHARVLLSLLRRAGREVLYATSRGEADGERHLDGLEIHTDEDLRREQQDAVELILGVGSVDVANRRREIAESWEKLGFQFATLVDPSALVTTPVELGAGAQVLAGAIVQPGARIGRHTILNTGSRVDHDCTIGDFSHLAPGVTLSGDVRVGTGCHLGAGCSVIQGVSIGDDVLVAAGAVVTADVPSRTRVAGVPARELPTASTPQPLRGRSV